ncbi:MAG: hypothetical protein AABP62_22910 [Planctomycetota bacterium]
MADQSRKFCPPVTANPADQPKWPEDGKPCCVLQETKAPEPAPPNECSVPEDRCCKCPTLPPESTPKCLEGLIAEQADKIRTADKAQAFKKILEAMLKAANDAGSKYTHDKHVELVEEWLRQDALIVEVIRKLVCAVSCWKCIVECHVCPLLNELHYAEKRLYDDDQLYTEVHDLYDKQYWLTRYTAVKRRVVDRISSVMKAWENPADTIGKTLIANKSLIESVGKVIGTEPGKAIYDVFLRLVPMHLAIAPPATTTTRTNIDKMYTEFCKCSEDGVDKPDDCCGPNVGELSLRQRLIGPQPYLIDPNNYIKLICCLVEERWKPAKYHLNDAEIQLARIGDEIASYEAQLKDGWVKNFETNAKGAIPSVINCCDYENVNETTQQTSHAKY